MDSLIKQSQATRKNGLSVSKSGSVSKAGTVWGNSQTISVSGGSHQHSFPGGGATGGGSSLGNINSTNNTSLTFYTSFSGDLSLSGTMTPSVSENISVSEDISVSMSDGDSETRPENYTIKVWKRIN